MGVEGEGAAVLWVSKRPPRRGGACVRGRRGRGRHGVTHLRQQRRLPLLRRAPLHVHPLSQRPQLRVSLLARGPNFGGPVPRQLLPRLPHARLVLALQPASAQRTGGRTWSCPPAPLQPRLSHRCSLASCSRAAASRSSSSRCSISFSSSIAAVLSLTLRRRTVSDSRSRRSCISRCRASAPSSSISSFTFVTCRRSTCAPTRILSVTNGDMPPAPIAP